MSEDIVDRLTAWVEHEAREPDPARAILDARDTIIATRKALMNLSAAVVGSDTLEEARSIAWKLAPLDDRSVLIQGFHEVEALWRFDPKTVEGFKPVVLPADNRQAGEPTHPSALHAITFNRQWIPVGERLPEQLDDDGCFSDVLGYFPEYPAGIAIVWFNGERWEDTEGFTKAPSHWMPLPPPPPKANR